MLKKIEFAQEFIHPNLAHAVSLIQEEIDGNLWIVEKMDINSDIFGSMKRFYPDSDYLLVPCCREIEPGVYEVHSYNSNHAMDSFSSHEVNDSFYMVNMKNFQFFDPHKQNETPERIDWENSCNTYGVADNVEQIKEKFKPLIENCEQDFIITVTSVKKSEQPVDGGWRWHKWGSYIGTQNPQHEYLFDEPEIEEVFCYHLYCVNPKPQLKISNKMKI